MARHVESTIAFPYRRSLGPVLGAFMTALTEKRILGVRNGPEVLVPPMEWDPATGVELAQDFVEVGPAGSVQSWTWVSAPSVQHPLQRPFAFAYIRLDGASTPLLHAVDVPSPAAMSDGMRVAPRWRGQRVGSITDICCFIPGERAEVDGADAGSTGQPVELMDYAASITYRTPVPMMADHVRAASVEHRLIGLRCDVCGRIYVGGDRPYCPVDAVELTPAAEVDLPTTGTITNYALVTPVAYPGQTRTEPFARVFVLLDDTEVVLQYQPVVDLPVSDVRVGVRVQAHWVAPDAPDAVSGTGRPMGRLLGWGPSGKPDVADPDLVNRIY